MNKEKEYEALRERAEESTRHFELNYSKDLRDLDRMLKPEELKLAQGFPKSYIIDRDPDGNPYPVKDQVARIGNSVVPIMAMKLAQANIA